MKIPKIGAADKARITAVLASNTRARQDWPLIERLRRRLIGARVAPAPTHATLAWLAKHEDAHEALLADQPELVPRCYRDGVGRGTTLVRSESYYDRALKWTFDGQTMRAALLAIQSGALVDETGVALDAKVCARLDELEAMCARWEDEDGVGVAP